MLALASCIFGAENFAVTSNAAPGTPMNASSAVVPTGAFTTALSFSSKARARARSIVDTTITCSTIRFLSAPASEFHQLERPLPELIVAQHSERHPQTSCHSRPDSPIQPSLESLAAKADPSRRPTVALPVPARSCRSRQRNPSRARLYLSANPRLHPPACKT